MKPKCYTFNIVHLSLIFTISCNSVARDSDFSAINTDSNANIMHTAPVNFNRVHNSEFKMKLFVAFLLMMLGVAYAMEIHHNGQPGCKTDREMSVRDYKNNWDPTAYWRCTVKGQAARPVRCHNGYAWVESRKGCVDWSDWVWEEPINPPSRPY